MRGRTKYLTKILKHLSVEVSKLQNHSKIKHKYLKIVIFFNFFSEDVLKTLLRGPKTIRKKYQVVFEKFANLCSKSRKKNQPPILTKFFEKKNIPIFFREYSKKCAETNI